MKARGVDPDHPVDRTTAAEWLALHRAEQADRERDQPIAEHDIARKDEHERVDDWPGAGLDEQHREDDRTSRADDDSASTIEYKPIETGLPDVRDVSTPDATERTDPTDRRRVPPVDEATVLVQRAQASLAEIAQRNAADTARAEADAAERDAAETARRDELTRWLTASTSGETADVVADDAAGEDDVFSRDA